jgi:DNA-binding transcriptional LysR family regulator
MSYWQSLSVFIAVAEEGSFSGAAKKLAITQPTVSFHIDNLEKNFGCPLFLRTARGTTLTIYGQTLYHNTSKVNTLLEETHNQLKAMVAGAAGKIAFGASTIPAEYILPPVIARFLKDNPGVTVSLRTGDSQTVIDSFKNGDYAIAIVGAHPGDDFDVHTLWQDEVVLVAHPDTSSQLGESPDWPAIFSRQFVSRNPSSGTMRSVAAVLESHGIPGTSFRTVLHTGGNEALKAAILNKVGVGFVSKWSVKAELEAGCLKVINLPGVQIKRNFYAVCRQPLLPTGVERFWQYLLTSAVTSG